MIPFSTIALLREWGRWGQGPNIGYPTGSAEFIERTLKSPLYPSSYAPPEILEVEAAICRIAPQERRLLIHKYQLHTNWREAMQIFGWSRGKYYSQIREAEYAVHYALGQ